MYHNQAEDIGFLKRITIVGIFFTITPIVLAVSMVSLILLRNHANDKINTEVKIVNKINPKGTSIFASLPANAPELISGVKSADARPHIIREYLIKYNSPLIGHEEYIVKMADKYDLDFRLTTAIAQQESNLCKKIPASTYNCWGWGIHSEGTLGFESYEDAIKIVSRGIRDEYLEKGYATVEDIMLKYTPLSPGSWASGVTEFMQEMQ